MWTITCHLMLLVALVQTFLNINVEAEEIRWDLMHQNDYDVIPHRIEVKWYNESYGHIDECNLVKYNRTYHRTLNASGTLIKEVRKDHKATVQLYKLLSNTYKFFPLTVTINVCEEFERNSINVKYILKQYTNIDRCPPRLGFVYGTYVDVDVRKLPPYIPRGDYRIDVEVFSGHDKLLRVEGYGSVINAAKSFK